MKTILKSKERDLTNEHDFKSKRRGFKRKI